MKNIFIVTALTLSCTAVFADVAASSNAVTSSTAVSTAQNAGNSQTITVAPVTTNIASDLKDQGATAAAISAAAAVEIAKIQTGATGDRDLSADQRAALDRAAAIEIARLGQTVKNTPGVALSQLVSSNDTCMGSVSVGGSGPGFSLGVGSTYTDENCKMLKNSRELWNMGMKAASLALMCKNDDNREALEITGFECPQTARARKQGLAQTPANAEHTDPIVRARLGLAPLAASK